MLLSAIDLFYLRGRPMVGATEKLRALLGAQLNVITHEVEPDVTSETVWNTFVASSGGQLVIDTEQPELRYMAGELAEAYHARPFIPIRDVHGFGYLANVSPWHEELEAGALDGQMVLTFGGRAPSESRQRALKTLYGDFYLEHPFFNANMGYNTAVLEEMAKQRAKYVVVNWDSWHPRKSLLLTDRILKAGGVPLMDWTQHDRPRWIRITGLSCAYNTTSPQWERGNSILLERPDRSAKRVNYF